MFLFRIRFGRFQDVMHHQDVSDRERETNGHDDVSANHKLLSISVAKCTCTSSLRHRIWLHRDICARRDLLNICLPLAVTLWRGEVEAQPADPGIEV